MQNCQFCRFFNNFVFVFQYKNFALLNQRINKAKFSNQKYCYSIIRKLAALIISFFTAIYSIKHTALTNLLIKHVFPPSPPPSYDNSFYLPNRSS